MGERFLIDTNLFILHFANKLPSPVSGRMNIILSEGYSYSFITRIELLSSNSMTESEFSALQKYIKYGKEIVITEDIILKTIEIRKTKSLKIPDAIIAATAIVGDFTLLTYDKKDFSKVQGLKMEVFSEGNKF